MKALKYRFFLIFVVCNFSGDLSALITTDHHDPVEYLNGSIQKVFLHLNKDIYITGENVLFKGYLLTASNIPDTLCKVMYVELVNPGNQKITGFSVHLNKGFCNSYFTLPDTLKTGTYYVKAFTNQMRNFDQRLYFLTEILIANQADKQLETMISRDDQLCRKAMYVPENSRTIKIQSDKTEYGTREKVRIHIESLVESRPNDMVNLLINVSHKGVPGMKYTTPALGTYLQIYSNVGTRSDTTCLYLPENKGTIFSGRLFSNNNIPLPGICVYLSVIDSFANLKYCFSDSNGRFFFRLSKYYDNKNLIFQVIDGKHDQLKITVDDKFHNESPLPVGIVRIPDTLRSYLQYCQNIALTNKVFRHDSLFHSSNLLEDDKVSHHHFYGVTDQTIYTADYDDLKDFKEIVMNILPGVYYNRITNRIRIFDQESQMLWPNASLVLLNNIPFPDPDFIANLSSAQIKKIELKKNHLIFGNIDFYGIVSITTNDQSRVALNPANTNIIVPNIVHNVPVTFTGPDYTNHSPVINQPDFRRTLYWQPELRLSEQGTAAFEFYTSDLQGDCTIEAEGISSEGVVLNATLTFRVK